MSDNISAHFTLSEVTASETADNLHIPNELPQALLPKAKALAEHLLEPIRSQFGVPFSPRSWYRSPRLNRRVGGLKNSQHKQAEAADIRLSLSHISNLKLAKWIRDNLNFDQLILEFYDPARPKKSWVHCSCSLSKNRRQRLTAFSVKGLLRKRKTVYALWPSCPAAQAVPTDFYTEKKTQKNNQSKEERIMGYNNGNGNGNGR